MLFRPCRLILVDNRPVVLRGHIDMLAEADDLAVIGVACDADSAFRLVLNEQPQAVAVNVGIARCGAFVLAENVAKRVRHTSVAFLADQFSDILLEEALRLKVKGLLLMHEPCERLVASLRRVCGGRMAFFAALADRLEVDRRTDRLRVKCTGPLSKLTDRQLMVVQFLASGFSVDEITTALGISARTVEGHIRDAKATLGLRDRSQLVVYAFREGLVVG